MAIMCISEDKFCFQHNTISKSEGNMLLGYHQKCKLWGSGQAAFTVIALTGFLTWFGPTKPLFGLPEEPVRLKPHGYTHLALPFHPPARSLPPSVFLSLLATSLLHSSFNSVPFCLQQRISSSLCCPFVYVCVTLVRCKCLFPWW